VYGTPSYYIQKLFGENLGDTLVESIVTGTGANRSKKPIVLCPATENREAITAAKGLETVSTLSADGTHLYVKLVNLSDTSDEVTLDLDTPATCYTAYELAAELDAVNTHENPENVAPVTIHLDFSGMSTNELTVIMKEHSVMVLDITLA
jgi:alpha-L-arabinofuranosidase